MAAAARPLPDADAQLAAATAAQPSPFAIDGLLATTKAALEEICC